MTIYPDIMTIYPDLRRVLDATPEEAVKIIATMPTNYDLPSSPDYSRLAPAPGPSGTIYGIRPTDRKIADFFDTADNRGSGIDDLVASLGAGPIGLNKFYKNWENTDRKHRMSELLFACHEIYKQRFPTSYGPRAPGFYPWLDSIPEFERVAMIANKFREFAGRGLDANNPHFRSENSNIRPSLVSAFIKGVAYLDAATRRNYRVTFAGARATWRNQPLDTSNLQTVFSGPGFAIWVLSPSGEMYAGNHVFGRFHHSSFLSGGEVLCGGEVKASRGRIQMISAKSGHYQPAIASLAAAVKILRNAGCDIHEMRVLAWRNGRQFDAFLPTGYELLNHIDRFQAWGYLEELEMSYLRQGQFQRFARLP